MSERRSLRRKPLADRTNTPILDPKSSSKRTKRAFSNSLTSTGSNDAQEPLQQNRQKRNPSDDPPHSSTPQPNQFRYFDDADYSEVEILKTYTRSRVCGKKKNKGKAVAASCPPIGRLRSFEFEQDEVGKQEEGDEVGGEQLVQRKKVGGEKEKGDEGGGEQLVQKKKIGEKEKGDEVGGEQEEGNKEKKQHMSKHDEENEDYILKLREYYAEVDAFKLPEEVASESELE